MAWLQGSRLTHGCCMGRHRKWAAVRSYWSSIQSRSQIIFAARQGAPCTCRGYIGTFGAFIGHSGSSWVQRHIQCIYRAFNTGSSWVGAFIERYRGVHGFGAFIAHWCIWEFMWSIRIPSAHWDMFGPVVGTFTCAGHDCPMVGTFICAGHDGPMVGTFICAGHDCPVVGTSICAGHDCPMVGTFICAGHDCPMVGTFICAGHDCPVHGRPFICAGHDCPMVGTFI